jgi:hypothetical protein
MIRAAARYDPGKLAHRKPSRMGSNLCTPTGKRRLFLSIVKLWDGRQPQRE